MTRKDIDILWQQAMQTAVRANHIYTRYEFANLILEKAAEIADANGQDEPYGHAKFRCVNIAEAIRSMKV